MSTQIEQVSIVDYLSTSCRQDQFFYCLAKALDPIVSDIRAQIQNNNILARLQNQPTAVLDFLAHYHFNLDVYNDTLDGGVKLLLLKNCIMDKILKGTPYAVKSAMMNVFNYAELIEWWQDVPQAPPNTFRIKISDPLVDPTRVNAMIKTILAVKNARSYFAGISSFTSLPAGTVYVGGVVAEYAYEILPYTPTIL